jgi:hypothetical protein
MVRLLVFWRDDLKESPSALKLPELHFIAAISDAHCATGTNFFASLHKLAPEIKAY